MRNGQILRLLLILLAVTCIQTSAEAKNVRVWKISQNIPVAGRSEVVLTDQSVRIDDLARGYSVVMSAPKWRPVLFAESRKVFCPSSIGAIGNGFTARFRGMASTGSNAAAGWKAESESKVCDRKVQVYRKIDEPDSKWKFYGCKDIPVNRKIASLVSAVYGVSDLGQLPLRFQTGHSKPRLVLDTLDIRQDTVDSKIFEPPTTYKKVSLEEVIFAVMDF